MTDINRVFALFHSCSFDLISSSRTLLTCAGSERELRIKLQYTKLEPFTFPRPPPGRKQGAKQGPAALQAAPFGDGLHSNVSLLLRFWVVWAFLLKGHIFKYTCMVFGTSCLCVCVCVCVSDQCGCVLTLHTRTRTGGQDEGEQSEEDEAMISRGRRGARGRGRGGRVRRARKSAHEDQTEESSLADDQLE